MTDIHARVQELEKRNKELEMKAGDITPQERWKVEAIVDKALHFSMFLWGWCPKSRCPHHLCCRSTPTGMAF